MPTAYQHTLYFHTHRLAEEAKETIATLGLELQNIIIDPRSVSFRTSDELDTAAILLIVEKVRPLQPTHFNEEPPYSQQAAIAEYSHACQNLSVISRKNSETIERLEAEAAEHGLEFEFSEEDDVWVLVPLKVGSSEEEPVDLVKERYDKFDREVIYGKKYDDEDEPDDSDPTASFHL